LNVTCSIDSSGASHTVCRLTRSTTRTRHSLAWNDSPLDIYVLFPTGGLLKSEKHAQREGFWAAHVLRPRGAQSQGVAPERRLFPIQQTTGRCLLPERARPLWPLRCQSRLP